MKYTKTLLAIAAMSALTMSCSDEEYFDKAAYDKLITEAFPVSNVDPDHDWQTVSAINIEATLAQSGEGESTLRIYDGYPTDSTAYLLATATLANGETFTTTVNCSQGTDLLYLVLTNPYGYTSIYPKTFSGNSLTTVIGDEASTTTKTRSCNSTRATVDNYTFADNIAESEYTKSVPDGAKPLSESNSTDKIYYLDNGNSDTSMEFDINFWQGTGRSLYLKAGKYTYKSGGSTYLNSDCTIYLLNGAELTFEDKTSFTSSSNCKIIVQEGAKILFSSKVLTIGAGLKIYNRGTIEGKELCLNDNSATALYNDESGVINLTGQLSFKNSDISVVNYGNFTTKNITCPSDNKDTKTTGNIYNIGTMKVTTLFDVFSGGVVINEGYLETKDFEATAGSIKYIINKCKMIVTDGLELENSTMNVDGGAYLEANSIKIYQNSTLKMGTNALVSATKELKLSGYLATVEGSSDGYALLKVEALTSFTDNQTCMKGNLLCCYGKDNGFHKYDPKEYNYYKSTHFDGNVELSKGLNSQNFTIAASECSVGYTAGTAMNTDDMSTTTTKLRYCYEDNFPSAGDYDFNDCVIDITPTQVSSKKVTYKVDLVAVGATKQIAAAMRLKGINTSNISNVTITGDLYDLNKTTSSINSDLIKQKFTSAYTSSTSGEAVIYLFNDAHYAFLNSTSSTGSVSRPFINTVKDPETIVETLEADPISCEITVEFNSEVASTAVGENCIDPFIVTEYNGGKWEIHTHEWQTSPVLYDYNVSSQYDINLPWALCLPSSFKYPKEWTSIGSDKDGVNSGAYTTDGNSFAGWCKKKTTNMDWYKYANSDLVY